MKRLSRYILRDIILEQFDELFSDSEEKTRNERDSADDQIDSFLIKFEKDSIKDEDEAEPIVKSLSEMSLSALIEQADPPEDEPEDEPEGGGEPAAAADEEEKEDEGPVDSATVDIAEPKDVPMLPIDVDAFIKRVARLAMNSEKLLDIQSVIINRALSFLQDNYDDEHVNVAKEILDTQFDFDIGGAADTPEAPYAVGAWAGGTGSPPTGGG